MRDVAWDTYPNARDLGGLPTLQSPTGLTQFGRVVRGPRRELLTADGWAKAREWGLVGIVDIRNANEVGRRDTDPDVDDTAWAGVQVSNHPTEDHEDPDFVAHCMPVLDSPAYWEHNLRILPGHVAAALRAVLAAGPGVLVHCAAGRDRTGLIAMLLLANAGVQPEAVAADFAASVRAMAGRAHHGGAAHDRQSTWTTAQTDAFLVEAMPIVERNARAIGTTMADLGITPAERDALRDLLVAP